MPHLTCALRVSYRDHGHCSRRAISMRGCGESIKNALHRVRSVVSCNDWKALAETGFLRGRIVILDFGLADETKPAV